MFIEADGIISETFISYSYLTKHFGSKMIGCLDDVLRNCGEGDSEISIGNYP